MKKIKIGIFVIAAIVLTVWLATVVFVPLSGAVGMP